MTVTKDGTEVAGSDAAERQKKDAASQPTTDPRLSDPEKTPGSGMMVDTGGEAPSG